MCEEVSLQEEDEDDEGDVDSDYGEWEGLVVG